jgi:hypothetical protein
MAGGEAGAGRVLGQPDLGQRPKGWVGVLHGAATGSRRRRPCGREPVGSTKGDGEPTLPPSVPVG